MTRSSWSFFQLIYLETIISIIRTLMAIDLVNSVVITDDLTHFKCLTFLLGSLIVTCTVMLFWIYLFLLSLVFVLRWLSLQLEILIMLLSQFPLTFHQTFHQGFLKLPNLYMLIKQKSPSLSRNLALDTFGKLLTLLSTKVGL